jgi:hypothetical protein
LLWFLMFCRCRCCFPLMPLFLLYSLAKLHMRLLHSYSFNKQ